MPIKKSIPKSTASEASESPVRRRTKKMALPAETSISGPSHEEIAEAAYHRYLRRGGGDGADVDDWFEAEQELRLRR